MPRYVVQIICDISTDVKLCSYGNWQNVVRCVLAEAGASLSVEKLIMYNMIKVRKQLEKYGVGIIDTGRLAEWDFSHRMTITDTQFDFSESKPNFDPEDPQNFDCQTLEIVCVNGNGLKLN